MLSHCRSNIFIIETIPHSEYITVRYPWNKTADTPEITGIPPDILILAEFESVREGLISLRTSIADSVQSLLVAELDRRSLGVSEVDIANKFDLFADRMDLGWRSILREMKSSATEIDAVFNEDPSDFVVEEHEEEEEEEEEIVIPVEVTGDAVLKDQYVREQTSQQLKKRKLTVGFHHGCLNPLPSTFVYPEGMNVVSLISMWLIGNREAGVPPLRRLTSANVKHFDAKGRTLSKMRKLMEHVESLAVKRKVWVSSKLWNGETVTTLWSAIWEDLLPCLVTESVLSNGSASTTSSHKTRASQIAWRTCYNNLSKSGLLGDKTRRPATAESVEDRNLRLEAEQRRQAAADSKRRREEQDRVERERQEREAAERIAVSRVRCAELVQPLSQDEEDLVQRCLYGVGEPGDILARDHPNVVIRSSMETLRRGEWLDDEVINYFLKSCLRMRDEGLCQSSPARKRSHFFNSFFMQDLRNEKHDNPQKRNRYSYNSNNIVRWGRKVPGK